MVRELVSAHIWRRTIWNLHNPNQKHHLGLGKRTYRYIIRGPTICREQYSTASRQYEVGNLITIHAYLYYKTLQPSRWYMVAKDLRLITHESRLQSMGTSCPCSTTTANLLEILPISPRAGLSEKNAWQFKIAISTCRYIILLYPLLLSCKNTQTISKLPLRK